MSDYEVLKSYGYSAFKSLEIIISAKRGGFFARRIIEIARISVSNAR